MEKTSTSTTNFDGAITEIAVLKPVRQITKKHCCIKIIFNRAFDILLVKMKWSKFSIKSKLNHFDYGAKSAKAQIISLITTYLFTMKVGIDTMTPTIILGAAHNTGYNPLPNLSEEQRSWIGSLIYLFPPVGSVMASFVQDRFGHRVCMMLSNAAHVLSITTLFFTDSAEGLCASSALMGFNVGFVTSFTISYCGEICDPKLRGTLMSVLNLFYFAGFLCITMLYAVTADWKLSVLCTAIIPLVNTLFHFKTPDSPMWLLARGRTDEAKQTLRKLRGDTSEESCNAEFQEVVNYVAEMNQNSIETGITQKTFAFKDLLCRFVEPETLKPLQFLFVSTFFINLLSGITYTPYLISVFDTLEVPFHSSWAMTTYMAFGVAGNILTVFSINLLGKRFIALCTMAACSICYLSIGVVGLYCPSTPVSSWIKIVFFFMSTTFSSMGMMSILWILMSELFPMKSKNFGAGVSSATYFIFCFLMTKFYLDLEAVAGFYNTFVLFGLIGLVGLVYLYFHLPETENKTLNEISEHFKSKSKKIETPKPTDNSGF